MNNKDLIKQYIDSGIKIPEHQYKQLSPNDLKTYGRKRIIAHNMNADRNYNSYQLDAHELMYLKPYFKSLPEINKKPFNIKNSFVFYSMVFPELLDDIPDDIIATFPELGDYEIYELLKTKPELIKYFKDNLNNLKSYHIISILETNPELFPYFLEQLRNIKYLNVQDMIEKQPLLFKPLLNSGLIKNYYLENILEKNPELYNELPDDYFTDFDNWGLYNSLKQNPDLAKNKLFINKVLELDNFDKKRIAKIAPELINYYGDDFYLSGEDAEEIIAENPKLLRTAINKVEYPNIIISKHPEYYKYLTPNNKNKVSKFIIMDILTKNPNFIKDFADWIPKFDFYDMANIVKDQPKLLNIFLEINGDSLSDREIEYLKNSTDK